ncbi:hypothetical protein JTB14_017979 [Gonioctena quinquepunctata]|nr:hypothetical protein JTB14_017979 [Gonioctena quinquepunctata]
MPTTRSNTEPPRKIRIIIFFSNEFIVHSEENSSQVDILNHPSTSDIIYGPATPSLSSSVASQTSAALNSCLTKETKLGQSLPSPDKKRRHKNRPHKISDDVINCIVRHINQFPAEQSHYSRNKNHNKKYLPPLLNVNVLQRLYMDQCKERKLDDKYMVKVSFYRHIFETKFNLSFGHPKSDTCTVCDAGENSTEHKKNWEFAFNSQKVDRQLPSINRKICYVTVDLQQTMPLPKLSTSEAFHLRQMWLYNLGVHCVKQSGHKSYFFTWTEDIANRGSNEIASCLLRFCKLLKEEDPEIDHLLNNKSEQQSWDAGAMQRAIEAVTNDGMAYSTAAKTFSVPRNTLKRRVFGKNIDAKGNRKVLGKYRAVSTEEQEAELVRHILDLEFQVSRLLGEAFSKAATPTVAINGFRKGGIVPLNQDVFTEADYVAAECTDVPLQQPRPNQEVREARQTEDPILEAAEEDVEEGGLRLEDPQDQTEAGQEYLQPGPSSRPQQIHPPVHNLGPLPAHKQDFPSLYAQKISPLYQKQKLLKRKQKGKKELLLC